jgi:hypothetical protein
MLLAQARLVVLSAVAAVAGAGGEPDGPARLASHLNRRAPRLLLLARRLDHLRGQRACWAPCDGPAGAQAILQRPGPARTFRGSLQRPTTTACPYGRTDVPSSLFCTMTAFFPAYRPVSRMTTFPGCKEGCQRGSGWASREPPARTPRCRVAHLQELHHPVWFSGRAPGWRKGRVTARSRELAGSRRTRARPRSAIDICISPPTVPPPQPKLHADTCTVCTAPSAALALGFSVLAPPQNSFSRHSTPMHSSCRLVAAQTARELMRGHGAWPCADPPSR